MRHLLALLGAALAAVSLPSRAESSIEFWYGLVSAGPDQSITVAAPYAQNSYAMSFPTGITNLAQATLGPAPAVSSLMTGPSTGDPAVTSVLKYQVQVHAAANALVHVDYLANFAQAGVGYGDASLGDYYAQAEALMVIQSNVGGWTSINYFQNGNFAGVDSVNYTGCLIGTYLDAGSFISVDGTGGQNSINNSNDNGCFTSHPSGAVQGSMSGAVAVHTDASGYGVLSVTLIAQSGAFEATGTSSVIAVVDPSFSLAAAELAADPMATLAVLDGVGNLAGAVPEPPTALLFLGLPLVLLRSRMQWRG